ncbi:MAG: hypothetical protein IKM44_00110, partial [Clostridia bacterium]|nr:hypothetical protein [Clostridia bacterium]
MKKTLLLLIALALTFGAFVFTSCDENGGASAHTLYEIDATFDEENLTVTASERVTYINKTEAELGALYFHLYPSAFRKDARYAPVGEREKAEAYPIGVDYGGITLSSVTVNGEACEWSIGGEDEDILMITSLTLVPGDKTVVDIDFTLDIPQARHRFGCFDGKLNLGNWYPIACVYENGAFRTDPYYSNGDPFYSEIADYKVSFTAPTGWNVAGTGSVKAEINGDLSTTTFTANGVRDFALTASEKYTSIEKTTADGVTVRYYYFSDNSANEHL